MLHIVKKDGYKLLIESECNADDISKLSKILKKNSFIRIFFISIDTLPSELVKLLVEHHEHIKLSTDSKSLWIYLRELSVNIVFEGYRYRWKQESQIRAIAIGGSAGALGNIVKIIKELPYSDITLFIVIHILPNAKSKLVEVLQQCTNYRVKEASNGEAIELSTIYVVSTNLHMSIKDGCVYSLTTEEVNYCRPSIDVLFKSLAREYGESLLSILTSGYLNDGVKSLKYIKDRGGVSIVQDPKECEVDEIPINAIATNNYTHIFGIKKINEYIKLRLNIVVDLEDRLLKFLDEIYRVYGYDFREYDMKSLRRRVEYLRLELGVKSYLEFENLVLDNREIFNLLFKKFSINVSEFFRNPKVFKRIREEVLVKLDSYPHIRVWCAACSHGQEPYSVAMMLDEYGLLDRSIIYATDFNDTVIDEAKNAIYSRAKYEKDRENYLSSGGKKSFERWFEINDSYVEVVESIRDRVHFFQHNLATDGKINEFHLIFCRNVLIYFDERLQKRVFKLIHDSLIEKGFLVLGKSEIVYKKDGFVKFNKNLKNRIFQRVG